MYKPHCLLFVGLILFLHACYGHKHFPGSPEKFSAAVDYVLQIDDFGWLWDRAAPENALRAIKEESHRTNTVVVLFIHGWHHNAAPADENLREFAKSLADLRIKLAKPLYRESRLILTGTEDVKVIGIYVGWRGKSLPMPLDYATFWGRKAAAERVGEGDLREFLLRLDTIYRHRSTARQEPNKQEPKRQEPTKAPFMGLVSVGHSFGAQVLLKAVASSLERDLIEATPFTSQPSGTKTRITKPLQGFGDLTVLVNPAVEAFQYHRIHQLSGELAYDRRQMPLLLVLSTENDFARRVLFPIGRWLDALFEPPTRLDQRALWTSALGEYEPQRTHKILPKEIRGTSEPENFEPNDYVKNACRILDTDLTDNVILPSVQLTPTGPAHQPFSPFIVAHASRDVIPTHTEIFEKDLRDFINDYVAILEGKKVLLSNNKVVSECPNSAR